MMELVHAPLLMAVSLVQSTVAFCRNISYYWLLKDNAGAKPLFCKMTTHQSIVTSWKNNNCLESLEWPAQSPDLNPIGNLWMVLKMAISKRCPQPKTLFDLQAVIREEWERIPFEIVQILIESIPRRVKQVIKAQGFATKY